jgi:hypothetical protein
MMKTTDPKDVLEAIKETREEPVEESESRDEPGEDVERRPVILAQRTQWMRSGRGGQCARVSAQYDSSQRRKGGEIPRFLCVLRPCGESLFARYARGVAGDNAIHRDHSHPLRPLR